MLHKQRQQSKGKPTGGATRETPPMGYIGVYHMTAQDVDTVALVVCFVIQVITMIAVLILLSMLLTLRKALPPDTAKRLTKVEDSASMARAQADAAGRDVALVKAALRASSTAARTFATELERGMR